MTPPTTDDCSVHQPSSGTDAADVLARLYEVVLSRRESDPRESYVAGLWAAGVDRMAKKLGEEAVETVIAAKNTDRDALVGEVADLWFHAVVVLAAHDIRPAEVLAELERRFGTSGVAEKAARTTAGQRSDR